MAEVFFRSNDQIQNLQNPFKPPSSTSSGPGRPERRGLRHNHLSYHFISFTFISGDLLTMSLSILILNFNVKRALDMSTFLGIDILYRFIGILQGVKVI